MRRRLRALAADGVPMRVLARDSRRVIVSREMSAAAFALLLTGVLLNAGAQLLLKAGTNALGVLTLSRDTWPDTLMRMATQGHFVLGAACYVLSLFVWILGLSRVPVSIAYPLLSIGYIVNAIAAHYLFGEDVTTTRWLGIGFIVVGVWLVAEADAAMSALPYLKFAGPCSTRRRSPASATCCAPATSPAVPGCSRFEESLSQFCGGRPVRVLTSATAAVEVALQLAGIGPGDEVITCAQSFFTVLNMIVKVGATPVFVDCDLVTRNLDLAAVEAAITPRTKAIMPTYWPGSLPDLDALHALARRAACG